MHVAVLVQTVADVEGLHLADDRVVNRGPGTVGCGASRGHRVGGGNRRRSGSPTTVGGASSGEAAGGTFPGRRGPTVSGPMFLGQFPVQIEQRLREEPESPLGWGPATHPRPILPKNFACIIGQDFWTAQ